MIKTETKSIRNLGRLAKLMDSQFKIPGTDIRFGLDALVGLIPGVGDFFTFIISGMMISALARNGASGFVLARMALNIVLDGIVGIVPIVGDIFDVGFRANERNMKLMREHYLEGRHNGSGLKIIIPFLLLLLLIIIGFGWLSFLLIKWLIQLF